MGLGQTIWRVNLSTLLWELKKKQKNLTPLAAEAMQRPPKNWRKQSTCYRRYADLELLSNSITWPACLVQTMNVLILFFFSPPLSLSLSYLERKTNIKRLRSNIHGKKNKKKTKLHRPFKPNAGIPSPTFQLENSNPPFQVTFLDDATSFNHQLGKNWTLVPEITNLQK